MKESITSLFRRKQSGPRLPPILESPVRFPYGPFQFQIRSHAGGTYEIHASSNLRNWMPIASNKAVAETTEHVDSDASKFSYRYYRVLADGVPSTNVLGYASVTLPPGFSMIANPFHSPQNGVGALLKDMPEGTTFNKFDTVAFRLVECVLNDRHWTNAQETFSPGEGAIIFNPTSDFKNLTFVGEVLQGSLLTPIPAGFSIRSSMIPQAGRLDEDLEFPIAEGDVIHLFDRNQQKYNIIPFEGGKWAGNPPVVGVGESFWVAKTSPANWVRNFNST